MSFRGTRCLVTGSSRGIGFAIAREFATAGAKVILNSHGSEASARQAVQSIEQLGGHVEWKHGDVSSWSAMETMFHAIHERYGGLDVLVNNAGITRDKTLLQMTPDQWQEVLQVNLTGTFYCTKLAATAMSAQQQGCIINICSVVGQYGNFGQSNYAATKAGIIGFTKSVARELAGKGIRVNAIAPGFIDTQMTQALSDTARDCIVQRILLHRFGQPQDVAQLALFLASEASGYVTGQVFNVDGGYCG